MGDNKTKAAGKNNYILKRLIDIALAVILIIGVVFVVKTVMEDFNDIDRKDPGAEDQTISSGVNKPKSGDIIYSTEMLDNDKIHSGSLIIVNNSLEYKGNDDDLVSMYDIREADGTKSYAVMDSDVKLRKDAANALNNMLKAFQSETNHDDIIVEGGYRSVQYQQELYDAAEDKKSAAKPGFSDYHTGYSIDFGISGDDGEVKDFEGKDDYAWFENNCYRYGFILRYPDGKKDKTGFDYRPWDFRYVGTEHAYYMYKNNLCLEEYTEKLMGFEYNKPHLTFSDDNGNEYEAYYYPADDSTSFTMVAVPSEMEYSISGNNQDGFIVCFNKNQVVESEETNASDDNQKDKSKDESKNTDDSKESKPQKTEASQKEDNSKT